MTSWKRVLHKLISIILPKNGGPERPDITRAWWFVIKLVQMIIWFCPGVPWFIYPQTIIQLKYLWNAIPCGSIFNLQQNSLSSTKMFGLIESQAQWSPFVHCLIHGMLGTIHHYFLTVFICFISRLLNSKH